MSFPTIQFCVCTSTWKFILKIYFETWSTVSGSSKRVRAKLQEKKVNQISLTQSLPNDSFKVSLDRRKVHVPCCLKPLWNWFVVVPGELESLHNYLVESESVLLMMCCASILEVNIDQVSASDSHMSSQVSTASSAESARGSRERSWMIGLYSKLPTAAWFEIDLWWYWLVKPIFRMIWYVVTWNQVCWWQSSLFTWWMT